MYNTKYNVSIQYKFIRNVFTFILTKLINSTNFEAQKKYNYKKKMKKLYINIYLKKNKKQ